MQNRLTLEQIQQSVQATPQILRVEQSRLPANALRWRPAPEEWCINEVVGHLIACDENGFAGRIQTILNEDQPQLVAWNVAETVTLRRDIDRDGMELVEELDAMRRENTGFITQLAPEQLQRCGIHPMIGELRVVDLLFEWIHHDRNHIKQILTNVQDYIWPDMGNSQKFFEPDLNPYL
jgi:hypothetical protein